MKIKPGQAYSNNQSSLYVTINNIIKETDTYIEVNLLFFTKNSNKLIDAGIYKMQNKVINTFWKPYNK